MMIIALTYRNRSISLVKKCLDSLNNQTDKNFIVYLVDYGSNKHFSLGLKSLVKNYSFIELIYVSAQGQLWNKSRAINIALKQCNSKYFLMGDIDLLYHPNFIKKSKELILTCDVVYFQYGFLSQEESNKEKTYKDYIINFLGSKEGTGTNIYRTKKLKAINGYDEFYHGWGAEDTDVHIRLKNAGYSIHFYDKEVLVKHLYHSKTYRTKESKEPFHTSLEKINHQYLLLQTKFKVAKANLDFDWGIMPTNHQIEQLSGNLDKIYILSKKETMDAFLIGKFPYIKNPVEIIIIKDTNRNKIKNKIKKIIGKKHHQFYSFKEINDAILSAIIMHHRLSLYDYKINLEQNKISLKIVPFGNS